MPKKASELPLVDLFIENGNTRIDIQVRVADDGTIDSFNELWVSTRESPQWPWKQADVADSVKILLDRKYAFIYSNELALLPSTVDTMQQVLKETLDHEAAEAAEIDTFQF